MLKPYDVVIPFRSVFSESLPLLVIEVCFPAAHWVDNRSQIASAVIGIRCGITLSIGGAYHVSCAVVLILLCGYHPAFESP